MKATMTNYSLRSVNSLHNLHFLLYTVSFFLAPPPSPNCIRNSKNVHIYSQGLTLYPSMMRTPDIAHHGNNSMCLDNECTRRMLNVYYRFIDRNVHVHMSLNRNMHVVYRSRTNSSSLMSNTH